MREAEAAHTDLGKCATRDHHECFGKKRETDCRARSNSVDSEWHFCKGERQGEREVGVCPGWKFVGFFSPQRDRHEE